MEVEKGAEVVRARAWQWGEGFMQEGRMRFQEGVDGSIDREERGILRMLACEC